MKKASKQRDNEYVRKVAELAHCDERSVVRYLAGLPLRPKTKVRIVEAVTKV